MASQVILKKSSVAARVPVAEDLAFGELALNYTDGVLYYKKSDGTVANISGGGGGGSTPAATATYIRTPFIATAGQTVFTATYTPGYVEVFYNGVLQPSEEYTAINGSYITLIVPAILNDIVEVIAYTVSNITTLQITTALGYIPASTIRSTTIASAATITPDSSTTDQYAITALAVPASIAIPTGTPVDGQRLTIRIEDNLTPQALTWIVTTGGYRVIGTTLPTTTISGKTVYIGCIYNINDGCWDVVSVAQQA